MIEHLLKRVNKASKPSRSLDKAIHEYVYNEKITKPKFYTKNFDDAFSLVGKHWNGVVRWQWVNDHKVMVIELGYKEVVDGFLKLYNTDNKLLSNGLEIETEGKRFALKMCLASLKSIQIERNQNVTN